MNVEHIFLMRHMYLTVAVVTRSDNLEIHINLQSL